MKLRSVLKSKLHKAIVTEANLQYEGSITIDIELMEMVGIVPYEILMIANMNNGERFETYVIPGERGAKQICLNGATARKGLVGDRIIILGMSQMDDEELKNHKPKIIVLSDKNEPLKIL